MKKGDYLICNESINNVMGWELFVKDHPYKILDIGKDYVVLNHILYGNEYAEYTIEYILKKFTPMKELKRDIFICQCNSLEHQYSFYFSKDDGLYCEPHLSTYLPFYKRFILGMKYIFGYKTKYGSWDSFLFKNEDLNKLGLYIEILKSEKLNED